MPCLKQINNNSGTLSCLCTQGGRGRRACSAKGRKERRNSVEKLVDWVFDTKGNTGERGAGICDSWGFYTWFLNEC